MPLTCRALAVALVASGLACSPGAPPSPPLPPEISIRMVAGPRTVFSTSEPVQLEAQVSGTTDTRVEWTGGPISPSGLFESTEPGTFTVVARSLADTKQSDSVELRVVARPSISFFAAEPATITTGQTTRLSWTVTGSSQVLLDGKTQTSSFLDVTPAATQTFVLSARNEAGLAVEAGSGVTVIAPPSIDTFTGDHPAITVGEQTVLRWTTRDATELRLEGQVVTGDSSIRAPLTTHEYLLEAQNALGFVVTRTVRVEVVAAPQILSFFADATSLTDGESTGVHWVTQNATELRLDGTVVTGTNAILSPMVSGTHVLEARNALGFVVTATIHITVVPAPVIATFAADASLLTEGQSTTLRWTTSAATELRLDGVLVTGSSRAITPAVTTDYVLEAKNAAGYAVTKTVRVTVVAAPSIASFTTDSSSVTAGQSTTLRWTTAAASELRLNGTLQTGTSLAVTPALTTDYVLEAKNAAGATTSSTVQVGVVPAPVITAFTADATSITSGSGTTLRWTTTAAAEVRLDGVLVSGSSLTITPAVTTDYVLEARNTLGFTVSQLLSVAVVPAATIASFTAARTAITQSEATLLSWSVSNATTVLINGSVVTGASLSVSPSATTLYTLEARNSLGTAVTAPLTLTVVPRIALDFAASTTSFVVGTSSTLSWTAAGAVTLTLDGSPITGTSLTVTPLRTQSYLLAATNSLGFQTSQSLTLTVSPYPGTVWSAAGQVWLRWTPAAPLMGTQTWDVYRSTSPISDVSTATLVGRLLPDDIGATRLKLADPNATWRLPLAAGGTTALAPDEAHFAWTPRAAETSFFAVVPHGSTTPAMRFGPLDESLAPITAHVQRTGFDAAAGLAYSDCALWLDGRAGASTGRADFPVMGPASLNGLATIFRVYASPTLAPLYPAVLVLHGSGGSWLDHRPIPNDDGPDFRLSTGIVALLDDAFAYVNGSTADFGTTRWFGAWDGYDRFSPTLSSPPNGAMVHPYTLRRVLWIRDWLLANSAVDPNRVLLGGHSMGALGAVTATRAFPDKFAGTLSYQCHTHVVAGFGDSLRGTEAQNLPTSLGASIIDIHDPAVLLASGDLPPMHLVWGTTDNMIPWADKPATIEQFSALQRGHQVWWDQRTHGYPWTGRFVGSVGLRAQSMARLARDQSYPAFSSEVSPDTSTANAWGTRGGYLEWDPDSIVEDASQWSVELWLRSTSPLAADVPSFATVTVDVSLRRPQTFLPSSGASRTWALRRSSDNTLLQSGTLTVSSAGLVTVPALVVPKERARLSVGP